MTAAVFLEFFLFIHLFQEERLVHINSWPARHGDDQVIVSIFYSKHLFFLHQMVLLGQLVKIARKSRELDKLHKYVSEILGSVKVDLWHEVKNDINTSIVSLIHSNMESRDLLIRLSDFIKLGLAVVQNFQQVRVYRL